MPLLQSSSLALQTKLTTMLFKVSNYIKCILMQKAILLKTEDIHPPKTGISVHFSGSLV